MEQKMLSFDMSTKSTGWSYFEGQDLKGYGKITTADSLEWDERIKIMGDKINVLIDQYKPIKVVAEDVPLESQKGMKTLGQLYTLHGILVYICGLKEWNIDLQFVPVSTWRRLVGLYDGTTEGKTRGKLKKHSIEKANRLFNQNLMWKSEHSKFNDDDISDSELIGYSTFIAEKQESMVIGRKAKIKKK
jgi:Holliday junction resolvasome RuvABC endonuclease subunit